MDKNKKIEILLASLYGIGALLIIVGAYLKINHLRYSNSILFFGFLMGYFVISIENLMLKKTIKDIQKKLAEKDKLSD